jgi:hypothetical protein
VSLIAAESRDRFNAHGKPPRTEVGVIPSKPLRVLPSVDASVPTHSVAVLRSTIGVEMLAIAPASTLVYRALNHDPDATVIATEDFGTIAEQTGDDLIDVLSSTPTVLLSSQIGPVERKRAAFAPSFLWM